MIKGSFNGTPIGASEKMLSYDGIPFQDQGDASGLMCVYTICIITSDFSFAEATACLLCPGTFFAAIVNTSTPQIGGSEGSE